MAEVSGAIITDQNVKEIRNIFETFLNMFESGNFDNLKEIAVEEVEADFSTHGQFRGIKEVKEGLKWKGQRINVHKHNICNFVALYDEEKAQQSAYVFELYIYNEGGFYPFEFGGHFANTYVKTKDGWKLSKIRYDLDWEKGNTYFASGWKLIDYVMYNGHRQSCVHEFDTPYMAIKNPLNVLTEEEKILHTMYRYSAGLDNFDFTLFCTSCTNDVVFKNNGSVLYDGLRNLVSGFRNTRHKEPTMEHAFKIFDVKINGDEATLQAYRVEPHRLGSKVLNKDNYEYKFYSAKYFNKLRKENGLWKLYELNYFPKVFFEIEPDDTKFIG